ncbi:hypothetical protein S40288_06728 [Stachybotrys chartarum IBT 40288]|nr:hypothetical protein S40288_06728 [Stachybotrys chartarum IBT 40288]
MAAPRENPQNRKVDQVCGDSQISEPTNGELCARCAAIDFDEAFKRKWCCDDFTSVIVHLGQISASEASSCSMCNMLKTTGSWCFDEKDVNILVVLSRSPGIDTWQDLFKTTGFLALQPSGASQGCQVRALMPHTFDSTLAVEWITYCEKNHRTRCSRKTLPQLHQFRVLDCRSRQIVDGPESCRYVALSYVWGKQYPSMPSSPMAQAASPATSHGHHCWEKVIEDSIVVTKTLGLDYLWVDRICIDQSDDDKMLHQIRQMDLIYAKASLTIIAAAGNGPDHGLPGVNGPLRIPQPEFIFPNLRLVSTLPSAAHTVRSSKWSTRAWTYQEFLLSTRRLIFTETQVLFECNGMHCSELKFDTFAYNEGALQTKAPGLDPHDYMEFVYQYSARELSHLTDHLNAFQGIINSFKRAKRPHPDESHEIADSSFPDERLLGVLLLHKMLVEGWTTTVRTEVFDSAESSRHPIRGKPRDGTYLSFSSDTQVTIYSEPHSCDKSWVYSPATAVVQVL